MGQVIAEEDYRVGLQAGRIPAPPPKMIRQSIRTKKSGIMDIAKEEFLKGYYHKLGEKMCELTSDDMNLVAMFNILQEIDQSSDDVYGKTFARNYSNFMKGKQK